jgi:hypothetical protein
MSEYIQCIGMFVQEGKVQLVEHHLEVIKETEKAYIVKSEVPGITDRINKDLIGKYRECQNDEVANAEVYLMGNKLSTDEKIQLKGTLMNAIRRRTEVDLEAVARFSSW